MVRASDGSAISPDNHHTWRVRVNALTGIRHESQGAVTCLRLEQNFPNPFNPMTSIRFSLPEPAQVSLCIYDVSGRLVRTLLQSARMETGIYSIVWDGTSDARQQVRSGIYLCRLTAGEYSETEKMIVLR